MGALAFASRTSRQQDLSTRAPEGTVERATKAKTGSVDCGQWITSERHAPFLLLQAVSNRSSPAKVRASVCASRTSMAMTAADAPPQIL